MSSNNYVSVPPALPPTPRAGLATAIDRLFMNATELGNELARLEDQLSGVIVPGPSAAGGSVTGECHSPLVSAIHNACDTIACHRMRLCSLLERLEVG